MKVMTVDDAHTANQRAVRYWKQIKIAMQEGRANADAEAEALDHLLSIVPRGLYEHFKSKPDDPKFYLVWGIVPDVNGIFNPVIHYTALYGALAGKPAGRALIDSENGFWGPIVRPNDPEHPWEGPRFMLIKELGAKECANLQERASSIATCNNRRAALGAIVEAIEIEN